MKKFTKLAAVAAVCTAFGAFALCGCDSKVANAMTEEDAAMLNAAFVEAQSYDGSYTLNEEYSSYVYYLNTTQYQKGTAAVTYDNESRTMGYYVNVESDGENYSIGYYTVPQGDGSVMQYVDFFGYKMGTAYAADESVDLYYTSYADCMENLFELDINDGSATTTVDGYIAYWQNFLGDSISSLGEMYGITLTFGDVDATVENSEDYLTLTFAAEASLSQSVSFMGAEISAYSVDYSLSVKIENNFITEITSNINQNLTITSAGESVNMKGVATSKDTFTKAYDSGIVPSDFSDYETYEDTEGII